nr:unnamed protein product [Spirometra erinaceieuropaei]
MASPVSSLVAKLVLQELENVAFDHYETAFCRRYVDDTFVMIERIEQADIQDLLNRICPHVQFTRDEDHAEQPPFLDVLLTPTPNGELSTTTGSLPHRGRYNLVATVTTISDNLVGKLVKELQKLGLQQPSAPLPEKLTRVADFSRWEARMKDYLRGVDASSQSGIILGLLDDEVNPGSPREILGASVHPWILQSEFRSRFQQPGEGVLDYQQALRLLGRKAFPTMDAAALTQRVLEQFVAGVRDPEVRKALIRGQPATLDKALDLARQEEALQAVCDRPAQPLLGIAAVRPQTVRDSATQTPWRPCSCGSYYSRQNQWRRLPPRRPNGPQNRRPVQSIDVGPQDSSACLEIWTRDLEEGFEVDVVYIDFRKDLDTVLHKRLLHKLSDIGIRGSLLNWIRAFLVQKQRVCIGDDMSKWVNVANGVPLGAVLEPSLFILYVNDSLQELDCDKIMFADNDNSRTNQTERRTLLDARYLANPYMVIDALYVTCSPEQGQLREPRVGHTFFWSGCLEVERRGTCVALVIRKDIMGRLLCLPQGISDPLMSLHLQLQGVKFTTVARS